VFGIGEHHRPDFVVSAPAVALAAAAVRTQGIRLTSAVTVLSSDDPVRVFQQFATVDLLSGGRAEIMAGRGSFVESFPSSATTSTTTTTCTRRSSTCCSPSVERSA
jgi:alkanesulfonate monooxygenase SsuD/methylene tetrahydromethanopterin reductase-like flavin-dependent oxidoreductase (luciferase family)